MEIEKKQSAIPGIGMILVIIIQVMLMIFL